MIMNSILIYDRINGSHKQREMIVDTKENIELFRTDEYFLKDKELLHTEHDIDFIHIW